MKTDSFGDGETNPTVTRPVHPEASTSEPPIAGAWEPGGEVLDTINTSRSPHFSPPFPRPFADSVKVVPGTTS